MDGAALEPVKHKALRAGACSGLPIGGHVTIFAKYMAGEGTVDPTGKIVFLECGGSKRPVTAVEEALKSLTDRGVFAKCAGVVLCNFTGCGTKKEGGGALKAWSKTVSCPVWRGYPYGHVPLSYGFDFQRRVSVDEKGVLRFEEPKAKQ